MLANLILMVVLLYRSKVKVSPSAIPTTLPRSVSCSCAVIGRLAMEHVKRKRRQIRGDIGFKGDV